MYNKAISESKIFISVKSGEGATRRAVNILLFALFTGISAQLAVPLTFTPVPFTLQTMFVVLSGMVLGPRDGFYAMSSYLIMGLSGVPVFAGFTFGPLVFLGPTGGYLLAFPVAALISGCMVTIKDSSRTVAFLSALTGTIVILAAGALYIAFSLGLSLAETVMVAVVPFAAGEIFKSVAAAMITIKNLTQTSNLE